MDPNEEIETHQLIAVEPIIRCPTIDDWYFVIYHTGKALAYYVQVTKRWRFVDGGSTSSDNIIFWYDKVKTEN